MYALKAEWKKFITFREVYAALVFSVVMALWGILPLQGDFWTNVYDFNAGVVPVLILFLQAAGLSRLFCWERAGRTDPLLRVGRFGLRDTFGAKLALTWAAWKRRSRT